MSEIILLLRLEHKHADELLKLIDQQRRQQVSPMDIALLRDIFEYLSDYSDQCHHPVEDLVYSKLCAQNPTASAQIGPLLEEHQDIANTTRELAEALDLAEPNVAGSEQHLRDLLKKFSDSYREHMYSEENVFFPMALKELTENDWREIEFDLFDRDDPLFDHAEEQRFSHLHQKIKEDGKTSWKRAGYLRRARRLRNLTDIEAFNKLMTRNGRGYRLTEHADGGFSLEQDSDMVIDIPKCSQARAAWCAYYFLEENKLESTTERSAEF